MFRATKTFIAQVVGKDRKPEFCYAIWNPATGILTFSISGKPRQIQIPEPQDGQEIKLPDKTIFLTENNKPSEFYRKIFGENLETRRRKRRIPSKWHAKMKEIEIFREILNPETLLIYRLYHLQDTPKFILIRTHLNINNINNAKIEYFTATFDPRDELIKFMRLKAQKIKDNSNLPKTTYFNPEDAKAIRNWDYEFALGVYRKLYKNLGTKQGLSYSMCPFCLKQELIYNTIYCDDCEYGANHGECALQTSDYIRIIKTIKSTELFTTRFYKNLQRTLTPPPPEK